MVLEEPPALGGPRMAASSSSLDSSCCALGRSAGSRLMHWEIRSATSCSKDRAAGRSATEFVWDRVMVETSCNTCGGACSCI